MTFEVTDREEQYHGSTTWVRCNDCGTTDRIEDKRTVEAAMDEAERIHVHIPMCVACGEPMPENDRAFAMLACSPCHRDDADGTRHAVAEYIATLGPTGVMKALTASIAKYDARQEVAS